MGRWHALYALARLAGYALHIQSAPQCAAWRCCMRLHSLFCGGSCTALQHSTAQRTWRSAGQQHAAHGTAQHSAMINTCGWHWQSSLHTDPNRWPIIPLTRPSTHPPSRPPNPGRHTYNGTAAPRSHLAVLEQQHMRDEGRAGLRDPHAVLGARGPAPRLPAAIGGLSGSRSSSRSGSGSSSCIGSCSGRSGCLARLGRCRCRCPRRPDGCAVLCGSGSRDQRRAEAVGGWVGGWRHREACKAGRGGAAAASPAW